MHQQLLSGKSGADQPERETEPVQKLSLIHIWHDFEIISLGTNRPHMDLPQFKEAAARLEAVQQQTAAVEMCIRDRDYKLRTYTYTAYTCL